MKETMKSVLVILIIVLVVGTSIYLLKQKDDTDTATIHEFSLDGYRTYLERFSSDRTVEPITNIDEAKRAALNVWLEVYGEDVTNKQPYIVFYDAAEKTWLVEGSLKSGYDGGVPYILIREDGEVLAVWHDK